MAAEYILAVVGLVFAIAAVLRLVRGGSITHSQTRIWLLIATIFAIVSAWLWSRG